MDGRPRVLVIDDNVDLAQNLAEILDDDGIEARIADGGSAGLEMLADAEYSLVVTDMRMPRMNGLEVLRYIKQRWPALPVVVITAFARDELLEDARKEGALRVMIKGVDVGELTGWIARLAVGSSPVLLVEDDDELRTDLVEILQEVEGLVPHPARDGASARRLAETCRPRGAVVDLRLPDTDGLDLARELRTLAGTADLPVLFISGHADDFRHALRLLRSQDGVRFLEKPFAPEVLLETVRRMLAGE